MNIGYARVSTADQRLDLQIDALKSSGCTLIHKDKATGNNTKRAGLQRAIARCTSGDVLVVWKLDRLGRSLIDLVSIVRTLEEKGAGMRVLTGLGAEIDTTKPEGRMIFAIFAALAEFERELIRERTKAGMKAARARGVHIGRPHKMAAALIDQARAMDEQGTLSRREIAARLGVDVGTLRRTIGPVTSRVKRPRRRCG